MSNRSIYKVALIASLVFSAEIAAAGQKIDFPCSRNKSDGRVLVDGVAFAQKLASLGYKKHPDKWGTVDYNIGYNVRRFERVRDNDAVWTEGVCRLDLVPR